MQREGFSHRNSSPAPKTAVGANMPQRQHYTNIFETNISRNDLNQIIDSPFIYKSFPIGRSYNAILFIISSILS
jgi:hypothetical protein